MAVGGELSSVGPCKGVEERSVGCQIPKQFCYTAGGGRVAFQPSSKEERHGIQAAEMGTKVPAEDGR